MIASTGSPFQIGVALLCVALLPLSSVFAQVPPGAPPAATPSLSPDQLNDLVAPLALYPDPLLGQVLAASTYPLEVVEAQQWLQLHGNMQGAQLIDAAKQQNWDQYLESSGIPYYAFRTAISGKATGAHIHIGPPSTKL